MVQGLEWRCSRDNYPIDGTIATLGIAYGHVSASAVRRKPAVASTAQYTTSAVVSKDGFHDARLQCLSSLHTSLNNLRAIRKVAVVRSKNDAQGALIDSTHASRVCQRLSMLKHGSVSQRLFAELM